MLVSLATAWAPLVMTSAAVACALGKVRKSDQNDCRRARGGAQPESPAMFNILLIIVFFPVCLFLENSPHHRVDK